ncbi:M20 family metallopeptidase [Streptomyces sp. JHA26]|uniref:M20 metallopeptidase family protein n=1 Tax=Streptomyces sp. JHA26 TaxID=1917143 RepID=UPI00098AD1F7|nr:M20 family metallopeptidase [Streptomyces sp. JHA26]
MFQLTDAAVLSDDLRQLRRTLHRRPEVGLHLPQTQQAVLAALDGLGLEITTGTALSSVVAVTRGSRRGPAVLLRADMDALPVTEATGLPYASRRPGVMHACGHDLHTAALVGAAKLLTARRTELAGDVVFMFQPGEEGCDGARLMIEEGVLDAAGERVVAAYGLHVIANTLPVGIVATRPGTVLAGSDGFDITVTGRGGHGSSPHTAADPVTAACEMVTSLQTMITRTVNALDPAVLTIGSLHAGEARNVIPETAVLRATVRTFSEATRATVRQGVLRTVRGIADAHGVEATVDYQDGYPVTVNDPAETAFATAVAAELLGADRSLTAPRPIPGSEDFSFVLQQVPGAYLGVGACPAGQDPATAPMNHSPHAVYDDGVLPAAAALLATLAARRLERPAQTAAAGPAGVAAGAATAVKA